MSTKDPSLLPLQPQDHPDNHIMTWSQTEIRAIQDYAARCLEDQRHRNEQERAIIEEWKEDGEELVGQNIKTTGLGFRFGFAIGLWWADRPWRQRQDAAGT